MKHYKQICSISIPLILLGVNNCSTRNYQYSAFAFQNQVRYVSIEGNFGVSVNLDSKTSYLSDPSSIDIVHRSIEVCGTESSFWCASGWILPDFSVPKNDISVGDTWKYKGKEFIVIKSFKNVSCANSYLIESSQNEKKISGFVFDYDRGLMAVYSYGAIRYLESEGFSQKFPSQEYHDIFFASPTGIWGRNPMCEGIVRGKLKIDK